MPKEPRFKSLDIKQFPFKEVKINMYEAANIFNNNIHLVLTYLEQSKIVVVEAPHFDTVYKIYKGINPNNNEDLFAIEDAAINFYDTKEPMDFLNWLYEKAPFISMVGYENN